MTQDNVSARDLVCSLPGMLRRFPAIAKGFYYYSVRNDNKDLTLGTLVERNAVKHGNRPPYAIPVFIRITDGIEKTGTFKYRKVDIQKAGYSLDKPGDEVYARLPRTNGYTLLTLQLVADIDARRVNF